MPILKVQHATSWPTWKDVGSIASHLKKKPELLSAILFPLIRKQVATCNDNNMNCSEIRRSQSSEWSINKYGGDVAEHTTHFNNRLHWGMAEEHSRGKTTRQVGANSTSLFPSSKSSFISSSEEGWAAWTEEATLYMHIKYFAQGFSLDSDRCASTCRV